MDAKIPQRFVPLAQPQNGINKSVPSEQSPAVRYSRPAHTSFFPVGFQTAWKNSGEVPIFSSASTADASWEPSFTTIHRSLPTKTANHPQPCYRLRFPHLYSSQRNLPTSHPDLPHSPVPPAVSPFFLVHHFVDGPAQRILRQRFGHIRTLFPRNSTG